MNERETNIADLLHSLYRTCLQGEADYRSALQETDDGDLRYLFSSYSLQRANLARQLETALAAMGVRAEPDPAESKSQAELPPGRSSRVILDDCARGEKAFMEHYGRILATGPPEALRLLLLRQAKEVEETCDRIRRLRGLAKAS